MKCNDITPPPLSHNRFRKKIDTKHNWRGELPNKNHVVFILYNAQVVETSFPISSAESKKKLQVYEGEKCTAYRTWNAGTSEAKRFEVITSITSCQFDTQFPNLCTILNMGKVWNKEKQG